MGFQFVRMECYSRKSNGKGQNVSFVLDEVSRVPGACEHVENPQPPTIVYGLEVEQLRAAHDQMLDGLKTITKTGEKRKVRVDQQTLLTMVASHPGGNSEDVEKWQKLTIDWASEKYGSQLLSVVRHDDESHPHLHLYVIPDDMKARALHPGISAKLARKAEIASEGGDAKYANKMGDNSYRKAMREFQDDYYRNVGIPAGLARSGPGRRRLSRSEWKAEQAASVHTAQLINVADQAEARAREAEALVAIARAERAEAVKAAMVAENARIRAQDAVRELKKEASKAIRIRDQAKADIEKLIAKSSQLGTRLRGVIAGWCESSPLVIANQSMDKERSDWRVRENSLLDENSKLFKENRVLKIEKRTLVDRVADLISQNSMLMQVKQPNNYYGSSLKI